MVLLDGKHVDDEVIDPKKHKFIGTFRTPNCKHLAGSYVACCCGSVLQTIDAVHSHWQAGHWEVRYEIFTGYQEVKGAWND
ncbi:hypothetical protein LCGC14_1578950 [marine sediment metagenome]|uniref:Uncharacterized protein n=1 Tax=marine sediment metagenome TaxID=412755 RepID=A0A0F9KYE4_9ZZZZ